MPTPQTVPVPPDLLRRLMRAASSETLSLGEELQLGDDVHALEQLLEANGA